ncbi:MAG: hypothetical protein JXR25_06045 [Pontiellaceae bacterium]|nr:hypothetical protein [Pontiellaceae bacterium]MBN2784370.1 hypothetical protein [Pontiellaceae bacterium]
MVSRNTLGAIQTVFSLNSDVWSELKSLAKGEVPKKKQTEPAVDVGELGKDIIVRSDEFIKDCVLHLAWDDMQELVAGLLRAMGYRGVFFMPRRTEYISAS